MKTNLVVPNTLQEAAKVFADPKVCEDFLVAIRWPNGMACPRCGCVEVSDVKQKNPNARRLWYCLGCKRSFSVKVGTIFEDSPLKLDKWFLAFWLIVSAKNGISSLELHRYLGVTQKTAWHMNHRIREAMRTGSFERMSGEIEADETFIGGAERFKHKEKKVGGTGWAGKAVVMGLLERGTHEDKPSKVHPRLVPDTRTETLHSEVLKSVEPGSVVYTDSHSAYRKLSEHYVHGFVDHAVAYAVGRVHTNGLENFWSLMKRCLKGTYVSVAPFHLERYLDEEAFRFNNRKITDPERFVRALGQVEGRRLTYAALTAEYEEHYAKFGF